MSVSANIHVNAVQKNTISVWKIIKALLDNGWEIFKNGKITFLPLHDNDMYNWKDGSLTLTEFKSNLDEKENLSETIGVILYKGDIGVTLLFMSCCEFIVGCDINRKVLPDSGITDLSWYLSNIIIPIKEIGFEISDIHCDEYK